MVKRIALLSILSLSLGGMSQAYATMLNWDLTAAPTSSSGTADVNSLTFSSGGHTVKVKAYCAGNTGSTGGMAAAHVQQYSGGLGIDSNGTAVCSGDSVSSVPNHAVDNEGKNNFLLFEFDTVMAAQAFQIGWKGTDSDIQAWSGSSTMGAGLSLTGDCVSGSGCTTLSSLGFTSLSQYNNVPLNTSQSLSTPINSRYVIISGALSTADGYDYFKINNISAKIPLPSSLALFGIGLAVFSLCRQTAQRP